HGVNPGRAVMLLPATLCMGYAFPLAARLLTRTPAHGSRSIGVLYAWNTLGSILGSLAAAFVLAGTLGTNGSVLVLGAADAAVALAVLFAGGGRALPRFTLSLAAGALAIAPSVVAPPGPSVPLQMPTFDPDAERYLHSPLARVITADGRNYVRLSSRQYDIISVDPPPPIQSAGTVVLYTTEFYADAQRRLRPGGLMLQWL